MHVLQVYKDYPPVLGGIEQHLELIARELVRRGLRVTVLVTNPDGPATRRDVEDGVEVIRAGRFGTLASTPLSPALARELGRLRPDVTNLHFPYPVGELAQLLLGKSRATVVYYHSDVVRQRLLGALYRPLMMRVLRRADRVLASSEAYRASSPVLRRLGGRCEILPLGIDVARFADAPPERVAEVRRRFPGKIVLFVGRLRYYKGVEYLIDAMANLDAGGVDATLLIAGRGPMEASWRARAAVSPAARRIHFLGDVTGDELPALYTAADLFVLPSTRRAEAFGIAQLEAMATGTPSISTELGTGTSEINRHGETGLVVPPGDADALSRAIAELLADDERRREMGRAAARAASRHDVASMVDRLVEVYREVLP